LTGLIFGYKRWKTSKVDAAKQFMEAENYIWLISKIRADEIVKVSVSFLKYEE